MDSRNPEPDKDRATSTIIATESSDASTYDHPGRSSSTYLRGWSYRNEGGYSEVPREEDEALHLREANHQREHSRHQPPPRQTSGWLTIAMAVLATLVPLAALVWFIANAVLHHVGTSMLGPSIVGGSLTYLQAKAIDFISSALLGPLLMVWFDYIWFRGARTTVLNEEQKGEGVPLTSLVEVSNTSSGGFGAFRIWAILKGRTRSMYLFAQLILLSGVAAKTLSNFLAYQAFDSVEEAGQSASLRWLSDAATPQQNLSSTQEYFPIPNSFSGSPLSISQQASLANQLAALLTGLSFEDATSRLETDSSYVGINATKASMDTLDASIVSLMNVPGYKLSSQCNTLDVRTFEAIQMCETFYEFTVIPSCPTESDSPLCEMFLADIPGIMTLQEGVANNDFYPWVAFNIDGTAAYLGILDSFNDTTPQYHINSSYGVVRPQAWNMTKFGFQDTKEIMTTWRLACQILKQDGFINYTRSLGQSWTRSSALFSPDTTVLSSFLSNYQVNLKYNAPQSTISGLGPPLQLTAGSLYVLPPTINFNTYALNFLYASGEAQRITYEVLANTSNARPDSFYNVTALTTVQHYRVTYIPLLLLLGILSILLAATITLTMTLFARNTTSVRIGRQVNGLRLVLDGVVGLADMVSEITAASRTLGGHDLESWADKLMVRYTRIFDEGGNAGVTITHSNVPELLYEEK